MLIGIGQVLTNQYTVYRFENILFWLKWGTWTCLWTENVLSICLCILSDLKGRNLQIVTDLIEWGMVRKYADVLLEWASWLVVISSQNHEESSQTTRADTHKIDKMWTKWLTADKYRVMESVGRGYPTHGFRVICNTLAIVTCSKTVHLRFVF